MTLTTSAATLSIIGAGDDRRLLVTGASDAVLDRFDGTRAEGGLEAKLTPANAAAVRSVVPSLAPRPVGLATSAGTGDRLGLATPGHVAAFQKHGPQLVPVFAQQSAREMDRVGRDPLSVIDDATFGAIAGGWTGPMAADADHLKSTADIDRCLAAGFTSFTLDPGEEVVHVEGEVRREHVQGLPWAELEDSYDALVARYANLTIDTGTELVALSTDELLRAAAKYGRCVALTARMHRHLLANAPGEVEVEVAIDETADVTTPAEHVYLVNELNRLGVGFVGFAPRYIGDFEKGVEYIGDLDVLRDSLTVHAGIARALGPYKLSLHSGSDKFSIYELVAETTGGLVHLKTSGTSWLTALDVVAARDLALFREIYAISRAAYVNSRESYPVSADPSRIPAPESVADADLPGLLEDFGARQVVHVGYGDVLAVPEVDRALRALLAENADDYTARLTGHIGRHLVAFDEYAVRG